VRRLGANAGDTSLYDAVVRSVAELGDAPQRSLIVLSDGADNHSRASLQAAVDTVARGKVGLDLVAFRTKDSEVAALQRIADGTGGRVRTAGDAGQLATAFAAAAQSFDVQVVLSGPLPGGLSAGGHTAHVSLSYGGQELSASHLVELATGTASPSVRSAPLPRLQVTATSAWIWAVLAVVFLALLALAFAVFAPVGESTRVRRRRELEFYTLSGARQRVVTEQAHTSGGVAQTVLQFSDRVVQSRGLTEQIALQLDRADMRLRPNEWLVLRASISVGAVALLMVLSKNLLVALVLGLALGWLGTHVYLAVRISRRLKRFEEAMPDTLQLVASSLQTGFSLPQALDAAVKDGREPIAGELGRALAEARLGAPLEDALDRVADRMDSPDFRWTVMAVRIQRQVGGNLAEVLQTTVHTMRERGYLRRQVKTLSAEGRLSAYILLALPIGLFAYLYAFRRPYISLLWTQPLGLGMSVVGVLLMVGGTFWMRQTVKVEV
ncbi:MAG: type II secretion system F family protein, partial [Motilibacteraceae bacterium]